MRGPLFPAGSYADVVHGHQSRQSFTMRFDVAPSPVEVVPFRRLDRNAHIELEFVADEPQPPKLARLRVDLDDLPTVEIRRGRGRGGPLRLHVGEESLGGEKRANFSFVAGRFLPIIGRDVRSDRRPLPQQVIARLQASLALHELERTLAGIRAVGPFRTPPIRRYDYQGKPADRVDLTGVGIVDALIEDSLRRGRQRGQLLVAVNRWLKLLGNLRLMPLRRISRTARLYEIRLRDMGSGRWANFADVGFGIGQALPVLVEGLRTAPRGLFIVEEPEIHLHPDAQLAMADYLIELCASGRTVIVETHSEAVLLRVRRAVARSRRGRPKILKPDQVSVIYIQSVGDASSAVTFDVDAYGQIGQWPKGFMEEVTSERLELLQAMANGKRPR